MSRLRRLTVVTRLYESIDMHLNVLSLVNNAFFFPDPLIPECDKVAYFVMVVNILVRKLINKQLGTT